MMNKSIKRKQQNREKPAVRAQWLWQRPRRPAARLLWLPLAQVGMCPVNLGKTNSLNTATDETLSLGKTFSKNEGIRSC